MGQPGGQNHQLAHSIKHSIMVFYWEPLLIFGLLLLLSVYVYIALYLKVPCCCEKQTDQDFDPKINEELETIDRLEKGIMVAFIVLSRSE